MTSPHSIVIGIADQPAMAHCRQWIEADPRFELVGLAQTAVMTSQLVGRARPSIVLMADDSPGLSGRDVLAEIARVSPDSLVVITTAGELSALVGQPAVAEVVSDRDFAGIQEAVESIACFLDDPAAWAAAERRGAGERRTRQDWSKVFTERRGSERRSDCR